MEKAIVTKVNWRSALNPTVTIYYNHEGKKLLDPLVVDLSKQDDTGKTQRKIQTLLNPHDKNTDPKNVMKFNV